VELGEKGRWYRLYAGPFASKTSAENVLQKIDKQIQLKGLLIRGE